MSIRSFAIAALAAMGVFATGCADTAGGPGPFGPSGPKAFAPDTVHSDGTVTPPPTLPADFHVQPGAEIFADTQIYAAYTTRAILNPDGTFGLEFTYRSPHKSAFTYAGRYTCQASTCDIEFDGSSLAFGVWRATGTTDGEILSISFNESALATDFENGAYRRVAPAP